MRRCRKCFRFKPEISKYFSIANGRLRRECKECEKKRRLKYNQTHETVLKERRKRLYWEHRDRALQQALDWQKKNVERRREQRRRWAEENREKNLASKRRWNENNKSFHKKYKANRRALEKGAKGRITEKDVYLQYNEQHGLCYYCGREIKDTYHIDHYIPLSRGGSNLPNNIVVACRTCNLSKHNLLPEEYIVRLSFQ